jgi:hypothetical protein
VLDIGGSELKLKEISVAGQGSKTVTENATIELGVSCCILAFAKRLKFAVCEISAGFVVKTWM